VKERYIVAGITVFTALFYSGILIGWHTCGGERGLALQEPGADNRPEGLMRAAGDVVIGEFFMRYREDSPTELTGKWSSFRGGDASNIVKVSGGDIAVPEEDYPVLWSVETGEGHAAPVIYNGRVYFLDYNEQLSSDALRCFSLETGEELWRRWYRVPLKRNHGFSRTVPVVGDDFIVTVGPEGHVMCCDPVTGALKWAMDMQKEFDTEVPFWYTGQCPLADGNTLVLAPAGKEILMAGVDCNSGETVWTVANTLHYTMSHSSVMRMTLNGKSTYVYIGVGGVCGVSAEEGDRGALLWSTSQWQPTVVAPSPLQLSASQIFLVAGYGNGGALLQVNRNGSSWTATVTDQFKSRDGLASEQQTPVFFNNMIISIIPKDGGAQRGRLVCYSPSNLRDAVWTSSAEERFGYGPYAIIGGKLFLFNDDGELFVYDVRPRSMSLLKRQVIIENGVDAWGPLAYADGMLIVRDSHTVKCVKIV
jgi:outer membrane protein assembly factor BamB